MSDMQCTYCGAVPDTAGIIHHKKECTLRAVGQYVPGEGIEHGPELRMGPMLKKADSNIERCIRGICQEEIAQHLEMARKLRDFVGEVGEQQVNMQSPPDPKTRKIRNLEHALVIAKNQLQTVVETFADKEKLKGAIDSLDMGFPWVSDTSKMCIREIERLEGE